MKNKYEVFMAHFGGTLESVQCKSSECEHGAVSQHSCRKCALLSVVKQWEWGILLTKRQENHAINAGSINCALNAIHNLKLKQPHQGLIPLDQCGEQSLDVCQRGMNLRGGQTHREAHR